MDNKSFQDREREKDLQVATDRQARVNDNRKKAEERLMESRKKSKELKELHLAENAKRNLKMRERQALERSNRLEREKLSRELRQLQNVLFHKKSKVKRLSTTGKRLQTEQAKMGVKVQKEELDVVKLEKEISKHEMNLRELQKNIDRESGIIEKLKRFLVHETKGIVLAKQGFSKASTHERGIEQNTEVLEQEIKKLELSIGGIENKIKLLK